MNNKKPVLIVVLGLGFIVASVVAVFTVDRSNDFPVMDEYIDGGIYTKIEATLVDARPASRTNYDAYKLYPITSSKKNYAKQASAILAKGYRLRDNPAVFIDRKIDWTPKTQDVNWHFKLNSWHPIAPFFNAHEKTGELTNLYTIKAVIFDWINDNIVNDAVNDKKWYDMATGTRAVLLAYFFNDYPLNELTETEYFNLLVVSSMHVQVLADPKLFTIGNHGLFQMVGLKALCTSIPEIIQCNDAVGYADRSLERIIADQFSREGIHREHSTQYHPWAIEIIEGVLATGLFPEMNLDNIQRAKKNIPWMFYPNGRSIQLGESDQRNYNRYKNLVPEVPLGAEQAFIESGYSFYRQSWSGSESSYLAFSAAYHSRAHKQADDLNFVWYDLGQEMLTDSGKYSYSKSGWRDYFMSTRSHNTVEIDGKSNKLKAKYVYGSALKSARMAGDVYVVSAELDRIQFKTLHKRQLVLVPGELLVVIDVLSSADEHTYKQWFHLSKKFKPQPGQKFVNEDSGQHLHFQFIADTTLTLNHMSGEEEPEINGWVSYKYQQKSPRSAISIAAKGESVTMITAFSLRGDFELSFDQKNIVICSQQNPGKQDIDISLDNEFLLSLDRDCNE